MGKAVGKDEPTGEVEQDKQNTLVMFHENTLVASTPIMPKVQVLATLTDDYVDIISQYDWDVRLATAIFKAESGLNPNNINPKDYHRKGNCWGSYGITQMGCVHFGRYGINWDNWNDPEINIHAAHLLYKERGWKPWGAYTDKSYLRFYK